jgi:hypothetical protein|tara:strand:- start:2979 stop:3371 length:393 start_codon:yes stop_codon:yes gene_type:complete
MLNALQIEVTFMFAAIFGILHVVFTLRVGLYRLSSKISLGDGGDKALLKRLRAHANFVENVPMGLLLLLLNELNGLSENTLLILGSVFLLARLIHYVTIISRLLPVFMRPLSMIATLGVILLSAILLLVK